MKWIILWLIFIPVLACAQYEEEGILRVTEESSIRQLLDHRKALNYQRDRKIKAWSVQIYLGRDKYEATKTVSSAKLRLRNITPSVEWFYEAPYYRIYVGGFYTKLEAMRLLHQILPQYPSAIIFKNTEVRPSDLP